MTDRVARIKASTSVPYKTKELLDTLEQQDLRPYKLSVWAKQLFAETRKENIPDEKTAELLIVYAKNAGYSDGQVRCILRDNGHRGYIPAAYRDK
jgi:hypothetical protein